MADRLNPGDFIERGGSRDRITSGNGQYVLVMQDDGNLVLYKDGNQPLWSTRTAGTDCRTAVMQSDGNFVVYHVNGSPGWASNTAGKPGCFIVMQNDGNLVIYQPNCPVFATNTVQ